MPCADRSFFWKARLYCMSWIPAKSIRNGTDCIWTPAFRPAATFRLRCGYLPAGRRFGPSLSSNPRRYGTRCRPNCRSRPAWPGSKQVLAVCSKFCCNSRPARCGSCADATCKFKSPCAATAGKVRHCMPSESITRVFPIRKPIFRNFTGRSSVTTPRKPSVRPMALMCESVCWQPSKAF